jgi:glycosyltransferase involved in cell wall biosynthesis
LKKILKKNEYIAFHRHTANNIVFTDLTIAKLAGIKNIIIHSHSTTHAKARLNEIFRPLAYALADKHLACGKAAGEWLYGTKSFEIINNGMQTENYEYSELKRKIAREKFGFTENDIVIGHVGRFDNAKNQKYIIEIFEELSKMSNQYKLILCGDGELRGELNLYCKERGLGDRALLLGVRKDIPEILQGLDLFVFPSKYEGLPLALIEPQLTGLTCFVSKNIPDEAIYNNNILKLGIEEEDKAEWIKQIISLPITTAYRTYKNEALYNDFDIKKIAEKLCEIYEK